MVVFIFEFSEFYLKPLKIYQVQNDFTMFATSMSFLLLIYVLAAVNSQIGLSLTFSPE